MSQNGHITSYFSAKRKNTDESDSNQPHRKRQRLSHISIGSIGISQLEVSDNDHIPNNTTINSNVNEDEPETIDGRDSIETIPPETMSKINDLIN